MNDWPADYPKIEDLQFVINETPDGDYELSKIYSMIWDDLENVNNFGRDFKKVVLSGKFTNITFKETTSENHAIYTIQH